MTASESFRLSNFGERDYNVETLVPDAVWAYRQPPQSAQVALRSLCHSLRSLCHLGNPATASP